MKSIMQTKDGRCYLCQMLGDYTEKYTEEHHCIFGTSGRKLSEKFGLKVYLCEEHHRTGKKAVHNNAKIANLLKDKAQQAYEDFYNENDFTVKFGRNYILTTKEKIDALKELRGI